MRRPCRRSVARAHISTRLRQRAHANDAQMATGMRWRGEVLCAQRPRQGRNPRSHEQALPRYLQSYLQDNECSGDTLGDNLCLAGQGRQAEAITCLQISKDFLFPSAWERRCTPRSALRLDACWYFCWYLRAMSVETPPPA